MPQKPRPRRSLISPKHLLGGVLLLLAGLCVAVYNNTRPPPPPVEHLPPVALQPTPEPTPSPSPSPSPEDSGQTTPGVSTSPPRLLKVTRQRVEEPPPPPPPVVTVTSPEAGATFTAPATITYSASVGPDRVRVSKVEFFSAINGSKLPADSICNNIRDVQIPGAPLQKRGEVTKEPYSFTDTDVPIGSHVLYAVVTDRRGVRQISRAVPILVRPAYAEGEIEGWRALLPGSYTFGIEYAVPPTPTPSPTPAPTPAPTPCLNLKLEYPARVAEGEVIPVAARVVGAVGVGDLIYKWTLSDGRVIGGEGTSSISVDTKRLGGTILSVEVEARRPGTGCAAEGSGLIEVVQPDGGNIYAPVESSNRLDNFALALQNEPQSRGYVIAYGRMKGCEGEAAARAKRVLNYLTKTKGIEASRLVTVDGGLREIDWVELWIVPAGETPPAPSPTLSGETVELRKCSAETLKVIADGRTPNHPPPRHPYTKCPDIAERLHFITTLANKGKAELNACPHNLRDPQNDVFDLGLETDVQGVFGKELSYRYITNGGVINGDGPKVTWDLSPVRLSPGLYTAAVEVDDGCGCAGVATTQVLITNFCTPCFRVTCGYKGADTNIPVNVTVPEWAAEKPLGFTWRVDKGRLAEGQNSPSVVIDASGLEKGTKIAATVEVTGLYGYCVNTVSYTTVVGKPCDFRVIDDYGNVISDNLGLRRARTKNKDGTEVTYVEGGAAASGTPESQNGGETGGDVRPKENEYLRIAWPEVVQTQRSFSVVVKYNRTKGELELTDETGRVTELVNTESRKLLRDWWGPGYEVWGTVKLQSSALGCAEWCRDEFKPLSGAEQKWTFNLKTDQAGEHTFNLELWIEGRPKGGGGPKDPEPVWSKDNLKIVASSRPPTKMQLTVLSVFSCLLGAGFFVRGIRFGNIKIMMAGGDIVGGDKVGGDKVGGDKIGGDKVGGDKRVE